MSTKRSGDAVEGGPAKRADYRDQLRERVIAAVEADKRGVGNPELRREPGEKRLPKRKLALLLGYRGTNYYGAPPPRQRSAVRSLARSLERTVRGVDSDSSLP